MRTEQVLSGRVTHGVRRRATARVALLPALALALGLAGAPALAEDAQPLPDLHLVTLTGPGTAGSGDTTSELLARQDRVLAAVGVTDVTYRWTAALNGFAARLTPEQVVGLQADPAVALVEPNQVLPMAGSTSRQAAGAAVEATSRQGGAGTVIGFVDSGLAPESPLFASVPGLGRAPSRFRGECATGEDWSPLTCDHKLVGAGWWVEGFGAERLRATESLSPRDVVGHGTQVASIAAGNSGVSVLLDGRRAGRFSGQAPQARIAAYKACWAAPDPTDDGCATADVVSAIDRATADRVDVLSLAVAGTGRLDTVELALLGAAEADVAVVAAAGNAGPASYAAHGWPWVTTVGAAQGPTRRGTVIAPGGPRLLGASRLSRAIGPARIVAARQVAAPGARIADAARCLPGTLDAQLAAGAVVVCQRGGIGRVDKSTAVEHADGVGMVLANTRRGAVHADFHSVPTVHVTAEQGRRLLRWMRTHPQPRVRLAPAAPDRAARRTLRVSAPGDPRGAVLKPDVVARGEGVLSVAPSGSGSDHAWTLFSGTSAAAARVAGLAAVLRSRHDWRAARVRSTLATGADPLAGESTLRQGGGLLVEVPRPRLVLDVRRKDYRDVLASGAWQALNTSSVLLREGTTGVTRRVTNLGTRAEYFSVRTVGLAGVRVTPLALRLGPGRSGTFRLQVTGTGPAGDSGWVVWRGARGSVTRIPVAITRR